MMHPELDDETCLHLSAAADKKEAAADKKEAKSLRNKIMRFLSITTILVTQWVQWAQWASLTSFRNIPQASNNESETSIFNPFRDLTLSTYNNTNAGAWSAHRCAGPSDTPSAPLVSLSRTCLFQNLYFDPYQKTFHYFASPQESAVYSKEELQRKLQLAAGFIHYDALERDLERDKWKLMFTPVIHHNTSFIHHESRDLERDNNTTIDTSARIATVKTPSHPVFVFYRPSYSYNFGHFLWDDAMGIFTMLDFFGYTQIHQDASSASQKNSRHQHIPVHMDQGEDPFYRCSQKFPNRWQKCFKMLRKTMPKLLGIDTDTSSDTGDILRVGNLFEPFYYNNSSSGNKNTTTSDSESELVLLPKVIAGAGRNSHFGCKGECTIHRTGRFYRFREWLFQNIFGFEQGKRLHHMPASPHKITISLPIGNTHSPGEIETFQAIVPALTVKYGKENVYAVDMAKLSIEEQATLTATSKVYLTNNGGGSATSFFLQKGSSVVLFHAEDKKRDVDLYSTVAYLNVDWVPVNASIDTVMKFVDRALAQPAD